MKTTGSIDIHRPLEEVFKFTTEHVEEWSHIVTENETLEETPEVVGTTFRTITADRGQRMEFQGTVIKYDPPQAQAVSMKGDLFDMEVAYFFEDLGGAIRVTQTSVVTPKGALKIVFTLFGWAMKKSSCRALQTELEHLKQILESPPSPENPPS